VSCGAWSCKSVVGCYTIGGVGASASTQRIWCAPRTSIGGLVLHKVRSKGWCVTPL